MSHNHRAGSVVHMPPGSVAAHRDLHFRLLRHNLVSDIQTAIRTFMENGGIKTLKKLVTLSCQLNVAFLTAFG